MEPQVPLLVDTLTRKIGGTWRSAFQVWDGQTGKTVTHERRPGFWSISPDGQVAESALKRRLSDVSAVPVRWHRLAFDTDRQAKEYAAQRRKQGYGTYLGDVDSCTNRILAEDPDFFRAFPLDRPLRVLTVDIEQRTDGAGFPEQDEPMVSISLGFSDGTGPDKHETTLAVNLPVNGDEPDDANLVERWRMAIEEYDPDIIAGFNVHYDLGVLWARAAKHGFPFDQWGREDEHGDIARSSVRQETHGHFTDDRYYIGGRIVWDLKDNANTISDYSLTGCKDFKLKTIAKFLGWDALEEDTSNTLALWRDRPDDLLRYNDNDVTLVEMLVARYLPDRLKMAEFFGAPLSITIDAPPGRAGTIASSRVLFEQSIVSDGSNLDRHRDYIQFDKKGKVIPFEGARIRLHKSGRFAPVYHKDFSSLYPTIAINAGFGPDNTRIIGAEPLDEFDYWHDGDRRIYSIPDKNYHHNWLIEVRGRSVFAEVLRARRTDRLAAKHAGEDDRAAILKILLNAMGFGIHGALHNNYGVWPVAIMAASIGRYLMQHMEQATGEAAIENDTDGIYTDRDVSIALLTRTANKKAEEFGMEPNFELDTTTYPVGYFYKTKAYLLLEELEGGKHRIKRVGTAFKGQGHPAIFDKIVERVGSAMLHKGRTAALEEARKATDLSNYRPKDFIQRATLNRSPASYKNRCKEIKLAEAYEKLGVPAKAGSTYEYVRTRDGTVPATKENLENLDEYLYLERVVVPVLERFGFTKDELGVEGRLSQAKARFKRPKGEKSFDDFMGR